MEEYLFWLEIISSTISYNYQISEIFWSKFRPVADIAVVTLCTRRYNTRKICFSYVKTIYLLL
jgi:hypothetical protein